jgi:hypothetical protein
MRLTAALGMFSYPTVLRAIGEANQERYGRRLSRFPSYQRLISTASVNSGAFH